MTKIPISSIITSTVDSFWLTLSFSVNLGNSLINATNFHPSSTSWRKKEIKSIGESRVKMIARKDLEELQAKLNVITDAMCRLARNPMDLKDL